MGFSFSTALSGLQAASQSLNVTGNNIANANTTAYKGTSVTFADIFTNSAGVRLNGAGGTLQVGNGVRTAATVSNFSQGTLNESAAPTNAAIDGNGFFVMADSAGMRTFTRAGDFTVNHDGFIVSPSGQSLQGYQAVNGAIPTGAAIGSIKIPLGEKLPAVITSQATLKLNLNAQDAVGSKFYAPVQVYDSKGASHTMELSLTKQADGSYQALATLDGKAAQTSVDGAAASASPVSFTFDSNGQLATPATLSVIPDQTQLNGATLPSIGVNLRQPTASGVPGAPNFTNYASPSGVASTDQNGFAAGELAGVSLATDRTGLVYGVFNNGQRRALGQIVLATFNDQTGLRRLGNNLYGETLTSGQASIGTAGSGGRGEVVGAALEQSNVDIATEFTQLIVAQRSFQANSRVINTVNQTLQELFQSI